MTTTGLWVGGVVLAISFVALAGALYGYRSELLDVRRELDGNGDESGLKRKVALLEGRLNQLARRVMDHEQLGHEPVTGPISVLDRPTPAQQVAPTRPDLEAQHPSPQADSYGRHASAA